MSKIKNIEMILKQCHLLLIQETWALPREVGKINQYFPEYNTYGVSGIKNDILLAGRLYGGCSFLYKKSLSAKIVFMTMDSDRICCVRLRTNVGIIYVFNIYFPSDNSTQCILQLYNEMLATLSFFFIKHNVVNCIIRSDLNTDLSRARCLSINNIQYTFKGFNQCRSVIDHFILSENIEMLIKEYYATDSIHNLSDHIPLYTYIA